MPRGGSSRVATRVSWSPLSGLKGVQPPLPFGERTRDCSPGHAGHNTKGHCHPRASSAKTRGFHTQLDVGRRQRAPLWPHSGWFQPCLDSVSDPPAPGRIRAPVPGPPLRLCSPSPTRASTRLACPHSLSDSLPSVLGAHWGPHPPCLPVFRLSPTPQASAQLASPTEPSRISPGQLRPSQALPAFCRHLRCPYLETRPDSPGEPGDLPDPGIKPTSPALWAEHLTSEPPGQTQLKLVRSSKTWEI